MADLRKRGCKVLRCILPANEGVNGPDDFVAEFGDEAMAALLDKADEQNGDQTEVKEPKSQVSRLVDIGKQWELFQTPDRVPYACDAARRPSRYLLLLIPGPPYGDCGGLVVDW